MSNNIITVKMNNDGTLDERLPDGSEKPLEDTPMRPMTEQEISEAASSDPDAIPMTGEQMQNARRVPRIKTMRRALQLTQEEFSARYLIPIGTLRDWEQGRSEPDQTARAYLMAIAAVPEVIEQALHQTPH